MYQNVVINDFTYVYNINPNSFIIRRFSEKLTDNKTWIKERSHESYVKNYSIVYPHDEPLASRNMRKDAFYDVGTFF